MPCVRRLQNCEEQEGVRRHSDARRTGRVGGQIRAAHSRNGRLGVAVPVGHGRQPAAGRRSDHPSASQGIVVARLAVHLSVRHAIVATAIPRRRRRFAAAFSGVTVPATAAEQHAVTRHRRRRLLFRAADRRQLDRDQRRR